MKRAIIVTSNAHIGRYICTMYSLEKKDKYSDVLIRDHLDDSISLDDADLYGVKGEMPKVSGAAKIFVLDLSGVKKPLDTLTPKQLVDRHEHLIDLETNEKVPFDIQLMSDEEDQETSKEVSDFLSSSYGGMEVSLCN